LTYINSANCRGSVERRGSSFKRSNVVAVLLVVCILGLGGISRAQEPNRVISIEDAYRMALKTNEVIRISQKEIDKSRLGPKKALSTMLPQVTLSGGYQTVNKPINNPSYFGNVVILPKDQTLGDIKVSNSIYDPNYLPARRQAIEKINVSTNSCYQTIQNVLFQVGQQYYNVLRAQELVQNARELIKTAKQEVRESKVKYSSGAVTEDVLLRALMDQATAENKLITGVNQEKLAKDSLRNLIGLKTPNLEVVKPAQLTQPNESYETLVNSAYQHRFDHKVALTNIQLAKTGVDAVKAKFQPSVSASWEYYAVNHPRFDQESNNWAGIVSVTFPVLEGGLRVWELKEAKDSLEQAKLSLADNQRTIRIQVENALVSAQNNKSLLLKLQSQVDLAQKNYDIVFSRFKNGAATMMDVSQAFAALDTNKTNLINTAYDYQISLLNLQQAEGIFVLDFVNKVRLQQISYDQ